MEEYVMVFIFTSATYILAASALSFGALGLMFYSVHKENKKLKAHREAARIAREIVRPYSYYRLLYVRKRWSTSVISSSTGQVDLIYKIRNLILSGEDPYKALTGRQKLDIGVVKSIPMGLTNALYFRAEWKYKAKIKGIIKKSRPFNSRKPSL